MSLLLYLALGALAVAVIFGLSTDVRAALRRLFLPTVSSLRIFATASAWDPLENTTRDVFATLYQHCRD